MAILLVAEHDNAAMKPATLHAVTAAQKIGGEIHLLVAGSGCKAAADAGAKLPGVAKVLLCDDAAYAHGLAENVAALLVKLAPSYSHVLAPVNSVSKSAMPRAAALLDVAQISEIIGVESPDTFVRTDLCRQRHHHRAVERQDQVHHRARDRLRRGAGRRRQRRRRDRRRRRRHRPLELRRPGAQPLGAARADLGAHRHLRRARHAGRRQFQAAGEGGRQAQGRRRRLARRGRCRLRAERLSGRPDRQDRGAGSLHRRSASPAPSSIWRA